jgi:AraC-like DNA-binding protein
VPDAQPRALYQGFLPDRRQRAFVWKYSESVGGRRPRHFHAEPELNLVVSGSATFRVGTASARVSAGQLLAFPAGQDHELVAASPDLYLYAIGMDPAFSAEVLGAGREPILPLHVGLRSEDVSLVSDLAASLLDRAHVHHHAAGLWERVHWLARRAPSLKARSAHVLTRRVLKRFELEPELTLGALAGELGTNPSEISRHFHRDLGMTLVRYRTRQRLLRLIRLVDTCGHGLTSASSMAGFGSYSQCHRSFQSEFGCSPRRFFSAGLRTEMELRYAGPKGLKRDARDESNA